MHRCILGLQPKDKRQGDHIDHNTLNNLRRNLRVVTSRKNHENRRNQSKYGVGIKFDKGCKSKPYKVQVFIGGKFYHVGVFASPKEAQEARRVWLENRGQQ